MSVARAKSYAGKRTHSQGFPRGPSQGQRGTAFHGGRMTAFNILRVLWLPTAPRASPNPGLTRPVWTVLVTAGTRTRCICHCCVKTRHLFTPSVWTVLVTDWQPRSGVNYIVTSRPRSRKGSIFHFWVLICSHTQCELS